MEENKIDYLKLALAFKSLGGGTWDYDIDAGLLSCSPRWYEILGIEESAAPIRTFQGLGSHIQPDDTQLAAATRFKALAGNANDGVYHVDFRIVRTDGQVRWIRSLACLDEDAGSAHRKIIGCVADITEFRQLESPLSVDIGVSGSCPLGDETPSVPMTAPDLTEKERDCLKWVSLGKTANETGSILGRSRRTVEFHLNNAVRKLNAANKMHAAALAIKIGII